VKEGGFLTPQISKQEQVANFEEVRSALTAAGYAHFLDSPSSSRESHTLSHVSEELQLETNNVNIQDVSNALKVADFFSSFAER
jgi:hypothetical protein